MLQKTLIKVLNSEKHLNSSRTRFGRSRALDIRNKISGFINKKDTILDIGTGSGDIAKVLKEEGHRVSTIDVQDVSFFPEVKPLIYDGKKMPFKDKSFDASLLITVLHHTSNQAQILREAKRVSKK